MTVFRPRILDASAMVRLFDGHPMLMRMLIDAEQGNVFLLLPAAGIAQAQRVVQARADLWSQFLMFTGVRALELTEHTAIEAGLLDGDISVTQVVFEARTMNALVVTAVPEAYVRYDVELLEVLP